MLNAIEKRKSRAKETRSASGDVALLASVVRLDVIEKVFLQGPEGSG